MSFLGKTDKFSFISSCTLHEDLQKESSDFDPDFTCKSDTPYESILLVISLSASRNLALQECDISNPYLYGDMDISIVTQQPTNSSEILEMPNRHCLFRKSL